MCAVYIFIVSGIYVLGDNGVVVHELDNGGGNVCQDPKFATYSRWICYVYTNGKHPLLPPTSATNKYILESRHH